MGNKMLKEMDRVLALSASENRRPQNNVVHHSTNGEQADDSISGVANGRCKYIIVHKVEYPGASVLRSPANIFLALGDQMVVGSNDMVSTQPMQDFDPSIFDPINEVDLFEMFDPAFDLDGFDACLEGNLNPAFPTSFQ
jgi:hypothetical protein